MEHNGWRRRTSSTLSLQLRATPSRAEHATSDHWEILHQAQRWCTWRPRLAWSCGGCGGPETGGIERRVFRRAALGEANPSVNCFRTLDYISHSSAPVGSRGDPVKQCSARIRRTETQPVQFTAYAQLLILSLRKRTSYDNSAPPAVPGLIRDPRRLGDSGMTLPIRMYPAPPSSPWRYVRDLRSLYRLLTCRFAIHLKRSCTAASHPRCGPGCTGFLWNVVECQTEHIEPELSIRVQCSQLIAESNPNGSPSPSFLRPIVFETHHCLQVETFLPVYKSHYSSNHAGEMWDPPGSIQIVGETTKEYQIQDAGTDPKTGEPWATRWICKSRVADNSPDEVAVWKEKCNEVVKKWHEGNQGQSKEHHKPHYSPNHTGDMLNPPDSFQIVGKTIKDCLTPNYRSTTRCSKCLRDSCLGNPDIPVILATRVRVK
ncbi:hypothetical protein DFH08DRAFT_946194 [Mycena albidolilacea]|uniref:Uncharacterized protein n=1 Tax=Mycena albidolilacea TaxID=1033008 RepID=A0AAD6YX61_9AGAR|nr:hypothetical protein DFH08DRAFT_946194 [Mycena albidolilacea]